jgi:signal transduction histidine kinase
VKLKKKWNRLFSSVRLRLLAWYCVLTSCTVLVSIQATRQIYCDRLKTQSQESLIQQIEQFKRLKNQPQFRQPSSEAIETLFDRFLENYVPTRNEYAIAITNNRIYAVNPALPDELLNRALLPINDWKQAREPKSDRLKTPTERILYYVEPVTIAGDRGVLAIVQDNSADFRAGQMAIGLVIQVALVVLILATVLAWIAAGRVLSPLRRAIKTAQSISESDMTRRIPVRGTDELAELSATFNEMLDRLQFAFDSQQEFLKDVSHELRTPITIVQGHLEMLQYRPDKQVEVVAVAKDELERMSRLVNDLLLLAKAERPDFLRIKPEELDWLTEELYLKARSLARRDWRLESKGLSPIDVDRQRLTQAVMNLVQNAIAYTDDGDTIAIGSFVKEDCAYIWISDTGEGIALEDQKYIFSRFARAAKNKRNLDGYGLGLSIVEAIVRSHGGSIELKSYPGQGATFTIVLPLTRPT